MMFLSELLSLHWQADTNAHNEQGDKKKYSCSGGQWWLISALAAAVSMWSSHRSWHSTSTPRLWTTSYQSQSTYLRDISTVSASHRREGYCASSGSASPKSSCLALLQNLLLSPPTCPSCWTHCAEPKMEEGNHPYVRRKLIQRKKADHSSTCQ